MVFDSFDDCTAERRNFLKLAAAGMIAGVTAQASPQSAPLGGPVPEAKPGPLLPTVPLGKYRITRMIPGANPIYGYSHFNSILSAHMLEYHTTDRVVSFLQQLERAGVNTWQASWSERLEIDWLKYKEQGGKLQLLLLSRPTFNDQPDMLKRAMKLQPIGIAQHGSRTNQYWESGQIDKSLDYVKRIKDLGALAAISCHNPREVAYIEDKGWPVDYYMTCLYYVVRSDQAIKKLLGDVPLGELYLPSDPPRMLEVVRQVKRPCLAFKTLAAGRTIDTPKRVRESLAFALNGIKPTDAIIVGIYQKFSDQIGQNAQFVREILGVA